MWNHHNLLKKRIGHLSSKERFRTRLNNHIQSNRRLQTHVLHDHVHVLNISVTDGLFIAYTRMTVTITPANKHPPRFTAAQYRAHVTENLPEETAVTVLMATDDDWGKFGEFTYQFVGNEAAKYFRISKTSGKY